MPTIGYALSSEEHAPGDLVAYGRRAEEAGFEFTLVSDHFHPWLDVQGNSPFVWTVLGALAERTERMVLGTGVTCPTTRIHPAIVAHAAATRAAVGGAGDVRGERRRGQAADRPTPRVLGRG